MLYFDRQQVERGKKIVNTGIAVLVVAVIADIIISLLSYNPGKTSIEIIINGLILINLFFHYRGIRVAYKITMFLVSCLYIAVSTLLPTYLILGLLKALNVIDAFGGALYLIAPAIVIILVIVIIYKMGFYDDILAYKSYPQEKYRK